MSMVLDAVTPEAIVARLSPYAPIFHECLAGAVLRARTMFEAPEGERPQEPWLFANRVRYELKQLLIAALPPGTPIAVEEQTIMSSVVVHLEDLELRFRKSEPGDVPAPGASQRMRRWYAQTLDGGVAHNILVLWHVDDRLEYVGLSVAFPFGGTSYAPLVDWIVPLPRHVGVPEDLDITVPAAEGRVDGVSTGEVS